MKLPWFTLLFCYWHHFTKSSVLFWQTIRCYNYRRLGFECEIDLTANCEFYTRRDQKNRRKKNTQWIMLHVTTPLLHACSFVIDPKHACVIDITHARSTCMHVRQLSIVENESSFNSSSKLSTCQHHSQCQAKRTIARAVWYSIDSPPHMQPHKPHLYS